MNASPNAQDKSPTARDYGLFAVVVLSWSASWYAIKLQIGDVSEHTSLFWRFAIAAACMWLWVAIVRARIRFDVQTHFVFAGMGLFIFCLNFTLFYFGGAYLISGLLSVVFSLASIVNLIMAAALARQAPRGRVVLGALMGVAGIALMFAPEIAGQSWTGGAALGLALCIAGTVCFCIGSQISAALQARSIPVVSASAWGMSYGATASLIFALVQGHSVAINWSVNYVGSLLFLAIISSVMAFWSYLSLVGSIGAGRAGYTTVMFPVLALFISALFEGYGFPPLAIAGLAFVLAGNVLVLGRSRPRRSALPQPPKS
ncbi:MAG: DMT family transporter [Ahrensia sp.]|nr:DMT family transporter [Ahrensia sp.]